MIQDGVDILKLIMVMGMKPYMLIFGKLTSKRVKELNVEIKLENLEIAEELLDSIYTMKFTRIIKQ